MLVATVESSTLSRVAYIPTLELLLLEFCSSTAYQFFGVPAAVHHALLSAPSKGRYFNHAIRGRFRYRLIPNFDAILLDADVRAGG